MIQESEIKKQLLRLANGDLTMNEFEDWLVAHSWNMHLDSSQAAQNMVWEIELALAEGTEA